MKLNIFTKSVVVFVLSLILCGNNRAVGQCGTIINTFPYLEDFESSPSWTQGGVNSDWAWGNPSHPTISNAASGDKAWCVGGLTGSSYNDNQLAFLLSPCFDFTNLNYPWISFQIFWENEFRWDGTVFQYSINNGNTWTNLGAFGEATNCLTANWYNYDNITWLTNINPKHGWTGRIGGTSGSCAGGSGSQDWVTAKHCMSQLAGEENVRFRFVFGSGNSCNNFDGIGIDDIRIENTIPYSADFSSTCINENQVQFTNLTSNCSQTYLWDFGDPNSGNSNASTQANPTHTFSAPGDYIVKQQVFGPCNQPGILTKTIRILESSATLKNISCFGGNDGEISVTSSPNVQYSWTNHPLQSGALFSNLTAGNYEVLISANNACSITDNFSLSESNELILNLTSNNSCSNFCDGSVNAVLSGGTLPYSLSWNMSGENNLLLANVCQGTYTLDVTDGNNCPIQKSATVSVIQKPQLICDSLNLCIGSTGYLNASGADFYAWSPSVGLNITSGSQVFVNTTTSVNYQLIGRSNAGCFDTLIVPVKISDVFAPVANFDFAPKELNIYQTEVQFSNESEGYSAFYWNFYQNEIKTELNPFYIFPENVTQNYQICVHVENEYQCKDSLCKIVKILGIPTIFVPNSFSPDGDGKNDVFQVIASDIPNVSFEFEVYNRWGERIFESNSMLFSWDGNYKGKLCQAGIYSWKMKYLDPNTKQVEELSGFINLLN